MKVKRDFIYDPSLVLYLPLYELDGASIKSQDPYGHLCTVTGALWRPNGRYFDGTDDYIVVPDAPGLRLSGKDFTIQAWFRLNTVVPANHVFLSTVQDIVSNYGWSFQITGNTKLYFAASKDGTTTGLLSMTGMSDVSVDTWYLATVVYRDGVNAKMYLDTAEEDLDNWPASNTLVDLGLDIYVGVQELNLAGDLNGRLGEVFIYKRALSPLEIQRNYLATKWRYR